jgi:hypothetical protein
MEFPQMEIRGNSLVRRDVVTDGAELETMHNVWCDVLCVGPRGNQAP